MNCRASDKQGELCLEQHYSLKEQHSSYVSTYDQVFWRGLGGEGGPFWLHRETLTFMGPGAYQNTVVFQIGVNKIPSNFDTLFATSLEVVQPYKGLTV
jgi:hypothetical protein